MGLIGGSMKIEQGKHAINVLDQQEPTKEHTFNLGRVLSSGVRPRGAVV